MALFRLKSAAIRRVGEARIPCKCDHPEPSASRRVRRPYPYFRDVVMRSRRLADFSRGRLAQTKSFRVKAIGPPRTLLGCRQDSVDQMRALGGRARSLSAAGTAYSALSPRWPRERKSVSSRRGSVKVIDRKPILAD